jgi:hypothetical protein
VLAANVDGADSIAGEDSAMASLTISSLDDATKRTSCGFRPPATVAR